MVYPHTIVLFLILSENLKKLMRTIFHCDINNCFASIEAAIRPELANLPIAVCGNPKERKGIVLAKSEAAKKCGVKTGETIWQAQQKCPNLKCVPPNYNTYIQYSRAFNKYYRTHTPIVEPFGLDECWLDMTGCIPSHETPVERANKIRDDIRRIFHVTISIGISFNKVFAKLGSDMKKPDAVTYIPQHNFQTLIWGLPVSSMLGVGPSTTTKLHQIGILTIGQLAASDQNFIQSMLGKNGKMLWNYANGNDDAPVLSEEHLPPRQSLGHGMTLPHNAHSSSELWPIIQILAERTAFELQQENLCAYGIAISIRDNELQTRQFQTQPGHALRTSTEIAQYALMLLSQHYPWQSPVRAFGIRTYQLKSRTQRQMTFNEYLQNQAQQAKTETIDRTIQTIQSRYSTHVLYRGYHDGQPQDAKSFFPTALRAHDYSASKSSSPKSSFSSSSSSGNRSSSASSPRAERSLSIPLRST